MTDEDRDEIRRADEWNRHRIAAASDYLRSRGFSEHPLLDNEEIEIVIASAFSAGARWERDRKCSA